MACHSAKIDDFAVNHGVTNNKRYCRNGSLIQKSKYPAINVFIWRAADIKSYIAESMILAIKAACENGDRDYRMLEDDVYAQSIIAARAVLDIIKIAFAIDSYRGIATLAFVSKA